MLCYLAPVRCAFIVHMAMRLVEPPEKSRPKTVRGYAIWLESTLSLDREVHSVCRPDHGEGHFVACPYCLLGTPGASLLAPLPFLWANRAARISLESPSQSAAELELSLKIPGRGFEASGAVSARAAIPLQVSLVMAHPELSALGQFHSFAERPTAGDAAHPSIMIGSGIQGV
jgi:hypothetical protein